MDQLGNLRETSDGELLSHFAKSGHQQAFAELIRRHGPMVLRICRRFANGSGDADASDLAQQVFLTLATRANVLSTRRSIAGWLYRTTWHVAARSRRNASVRAGHEREAAAMRAAESVGRTPSDPVPFAVITGEMSDALHRALATLPEMHREALVMHHFAGHTVEETARLLGVKTGTVASWISRGRVMLRSRLDGMGVYVPASVYALWLDARHAEDPACEHNGLPGDVCADVLHDAVAARRTSAGASASSGSVVGAGVGGCGLGASGAGGAAFGISRGLAALLALGIGGTAFASGAGGGGGGGAVGTGGLGMLADVVQQVTHVAKMGAQPGGKKPDAPAPPRPSNLGDAPALRFTPAAGGSTGAIPEPSGVVLLLGAAGYVLVRRPASR